jgi:ribosomal protein S18 acetylase RimI-like enzyme
VSPAHPLDRPVWSALTSRQSHLAVGDGRALRFDADYALFAAAADDADDSVAALARLLPAGGAMGLVEAGDVRLPDGLTARSSACVQMTLSALTPGGPEPAFEPLGEADAAQMLALATLTEPGPFFSRTHRLGDFIGVRQGGRLVAMAGERMKPDGFTEVSGVCTHPDWRGRGYAAGLMRIVAARILARGETPFLHAYAQNGPAIQLHQSLGFAVRTAIAFTVLTAAPSQGPYGHG